MLFSSHRKAELRDPTKAYCEQVRKVPSHGALQIEGLCVSSLASAPPFLAEFVRKLPINIAEMSQVPTLYVFSARKVMLHLIPAVCIFPERSDTDRGET